MEELSPLDMRLLVMADLGLQVWEIASNMYKQLEQKI